MLCDREKDYVVAIRYGNKNAEEVLRSEYGPVMGSVSVCKEKMFEDYLRHIKVMHQGSILKGLTYKGKRPDEFLMRIKVPKNDSSIMRKRYNDWLVKDLLPLLMVETDDL
jgi:hypothetical protein